MDRRDFLKMAGLSVAAGGLCPGTAPASEATGPRPNVLWISLEDISPDLGCYGDEYADTPNIDRLAEEGTRFDNAFTSHGVCAPVRSGLIMSYYASAAGTNPMRCKGVPPEPVRCYSEYLRRAGYYCTNNSKTDYQFDPPDTAWDECSGKGHWRNRPDGAPFFAIVNLTSTHESRIRSPKGRKAELHDPDKAKVPPYYPDTPVTRNDWACYHDNLTTTDEKVGQILQDLADDGLADDTIVWFWGDHGRGLPRAKRWIYDSGIHIPLIIRVPEKFRAWASPGNPQAMTAGTVNTDMVSSIDFGATMLSLAGAAVPQHMHGRPFLGPRKAEPREAVFAARDRIDEIYDCMRSVRDRRFIYIRNFMPHLPRSQHIAYMDLMPTMQEMRRLNAEGKLKGPQKQYFEQPRPVEELYDLNADPHEVNNLASDPNHKAVAREMRMKVYSWMREIGDVGLIPEPDFDMMKRPNDQYEKTAAPGVRVQGASGADQPCTVELQCLTPGSSIAYRIEGPGGTWKGTRWEVYDGPVRLKPGQTLKAKGIRIGFRDSSEVVFRCGGRAIVPEEDTSKEHWKKQLEGTDLLERLLQVKELDFLGNRARDQYIRLLDDEWGPVRYWAALGLHLTCGDSDSRRRAAEALRPHLEDTSPSTRITTAETLCEWGASPEEALAVLVTALKGGTDQEQLFAAHAFDRLGGKARPVLGGLKQKLAHSGGYVKNVLSRVVSNLENA